MCAIVSWAGKLPPRLLQNLLVEAECRGKDGTGIAFRDNDKKELVLYKTDDRARTFAREQKTHLREAKLSHRGIMHTRRASIGMPIDGKNAHPFTYLNYMFAHNGSVKMWREFRDHEIIQTEAELEICDPDDVQLRVTLEKKIDYLTNARTDSMVLGPLINRRDLSEVKGSFGLTWLHGDKAYAMYSRQDLVGFKCNWEYVPGEGKDLRPRSFSLVASTAGIVHRAFAALAPNTITYDLIELELLEAHVYRLEPDTLWDEGAIPVNTDNDVDQFTRGELQEKV